ncbi:MAG: hypothetical protein Kow0062_21680 [Acidobacteriota bacterium]
MDRLACVDVPALPLQLLLRREPGWRDVPAVVVERDHPQARVLWVSEAARRSQVLPGMRYAQALSLERGLRAGVVEREEIRRGVAALVRRLHGFAPRVEADDDEPGTFWLDVSGLRRLWPSATAWAEAVRRDLAADGFRASIVVGFTRFGTFAMARVTDGCRVFADPAAEQVAARNVPLARLDIDPAMRAQLARLGVHTVGAFLELPAGGVRERWGPEAHRLRLLAAGELRLPLDPRAVERPRRRTLEFEHPEADSGRLLFAVKRLLDPLLAELADGRRAVTALVLSLRLAGGATRRDEIRPAQPSLEAARLLELVRLRLEGRALEAPAEEITLEVRGVVATAHQLAMFATRRGRDLAAAERALARVRTELGEQAVVRARLAEGHLPEAGFLWEPLARLAEPRPGEAAERTLVRRLYGRPVPLPPRPHHLRDDGWLIRGAEHGPVVRFIGPYIVSGGWWVRPVHREYHFALTRRGDLLWVFHDRRRRRWYQHGRVE